MAVGVLSALAEKNVSVPGEMSVVGFDDIPIAHYVAPPLTTIRVDIAELGRRAFAVLCDSIDASRKSGSKSECISTTLVVRKSCAAPSSKGKRRR
jgi:LacI family transcriptional regulator